MVNGAKTYCTECAEYMCEEHRRAHTQTRVTKGHTLTHVRNLRLAEEMVAVEDVPLVLPETTARRRT